MSLALIIEIIFGVSALFGIGGIVVWRLKLRHEKQIEKKDKECIYNWLSNNSGQSKYKFRSTRTIASHTNLTEDRVRYICSIDERIVLSTGEKEDIWGLKGVVRKSGGK